MLYRKDGTIVKTNKKTSSKRGVDSVEPAPRGTLGKGQGVGGSYGKYKSGRLWFHLALSTPGCAAWVHITRSHSSS